MCAYVCGKCVCVHACVCEVLSFSLADGWLEFARLRAEFAPQANGWGSFLPWHRYFLWSVERALRNASWCGVSIPYLEWTVDAGAPESSAAWQANVLGGDGDQHNECVWLHPFQPSSLSGQPQRWSPCLRRRFNASVSLPDAVTMQLITMETDFLKFSARLQAASGLFLLWVGGHMATPFCAYDPAFLSHAAFVDRLWELWQERRAAADVMAGTISTTSSSSSGGLPGPDWYPEKLRFVRLEPFGVSMEDMSSQRLCTIYIPISLGSPCNHTDTRTHHTHAASDQSSHPHMSHTTVVGESEEEERVFDRRGFDAEGYDRSGYDIMGWDRHGFARDNYNRDHVDRQGYDSFGFDRYGFTRANLTSFGLRRNGKLLLPALGNRLMDQLFPDGFNRYGYSPLGLDQRGFDAFGFSREGVDQDGCNFFFSGPHYLRFYFHALLNMSLLPPRTLAHTPRICPPISPLPAHWVNQNWVGVSSDKQEEGWSTLIGVLVEEWANQRPFQQDYNPNVSPVKKNGLWLPLTPDLRFCFAWQWYSGCPFGSALMTCPDLCQSAHCHGQPRAVCRMITCGECHTQWVEPNSGQPIECQDG
ncbi:uncharacterized protein LOC134447174 [Engraulis encrasicolus]|uniref:uncharacterized protein LOC134447174 n=1 Tax=Engraulis encrasicolus TaxID=184585 RepID=UPI002FCE7A15